MALNGTAGFDCGVGVGFVGWGAFCPGWTFWFGIGVRAESPGGGGIDSVRPSIGVKNSEAEGVGEVICANVSDNRGV